jgi:glycosyltransferase involved in cell wall biosynthesis
VWSYDADVKCSVILPVWNAASTLERAIESIVAQSFEDWELVIVNDGSTDGSGEIAERWLHDARVQVHHFERRRGVVDASNMALAYSKGEFVARMDADDRALPGKLAAQVAMMEARPELAVVGCGVRVLSEGEGFLRYVEWGNLLVEPERIAAERFVESPLVNPTAMFRGEVIRAFGGWRDVTWAEDYDLFLMLLDAGMKMAKVPEVLFEWSDGADRLTWTDGRYSQENFLRAKAHFLGRLPSVRKNGVRICGAGPIGKRVARFLAEEGVVVHGFYEVNERRIGEEIGGVMVFPQEEMVKGDVIVLGAVGIDGARSNVLGLAVDAGFEEGVDFFSVC